MKIAVDTNRIIAALIKGSTTRGILYDRKFEFVTCDYTIAEINEHRDELKEKANLNNEEFEILLALIFEHIEVIPESDYNDYIDECQDVIDEDDIPILAVAIACKVDGIWTHDPHFRKQERIKVLTNIDLLKQS